jgi:aryl-alcohol dehydrogenase-like predicted oxidoreductase
MEVIERDGIRISRLTLGTVQLGMPYGIANKSGQPDEHLARQVLDAAANGGIVSYDTAQGYGSSESVLGRYFESRSGFTLISKMLLNLDALASEAEIERCLTEKIEGSLKRLKLKQIPVMMLHHASDLLKYGRKLTEACRSLVRNGYARKCGVSFGADSVPLTREIWSVARNPLFEAIQVPVNVLDHRLLASGLLQEMNEAGKIIFARSIYLQGLLFLETGKIPAGLEEAGPWLDRLRDIAEREGMTLPEMAMAYVRDLPQVHSLVIGAEAPGQIVNNLAWFHGPAISEHVRHEISAIAANVPERIISPHLWNRL